MSELTRFQDAFTAALAGAGDALAPWLPPDRAAGLMVYRNTTTKGLVDALAASFPTVERLAGQAWFGAAAREFAAGHPPTRPALVAYGEDFPAWLAAFPPAGALPYLAEAARMDRLWTEAHLAADAEPLGPEAMAGLDAEALERTRAVLHPSVRLAWCEDNSPSLWLANRPPAPPPGDFELADKPEGLLLARPGAVVLSRRVDEPEAAFIAACGEGASLARAAVAALAAGDGADLATIVAAAFEDGLFVALEPIS
jgi:hypothetical protein